MFQSQEILTNRYQLQQQLGRTAAGHQTWLALDLTSNEQVTIKLLAFSPQMEWHELKLFEREAQILQSLHHPRIPRYRDYFDLDKTVGGGIPWFVLVQDYIPGASLQDLLEQGKRFSEKEIRSIATEVLEILIYLHQLSPLVLHRDIKPSNLILGKDNHIYLIDFGAVQAQASVTGVTFTVVGTSGYAPLEQFWGRAVPASDIYGLGATLIHLLTGISPIDLPHQNSQIQFAHKVSIKPDLLSWIEQSTQIPVEKRFSSAREALDALQSGHLLRENRSRFSSHNKLIQPLKSRINLIRKMEAIDIFFPSLFNQSINSFQLGIGLSVLIFLYVVFFPLAIFLSIIIILGFKNVHVHFTQKYFKIYYKIFDFTYSVKEETNYQLIGVFLHSGKRNYQVRLRTKQGSYIIGENLQEEECAWLGQEIQDWLYH
ncbi:serine/threonine protein kinase [Gloeothece citriformis PCC 7424]|uniref:Serine/threonine protein kinase n=1 Tax=Gloeothece citriformis (strain PCC 7424) TaxID=65393 RepID=B7KDZ0_GLOC7|nr:serine/threonine-protein kinase [Gloeothece citriformis]ACK71688.1 serine/threonine protein kinase [Gloeothece citriformis PCC 7424]